MSFSNWKDPDAVSIPAVGLGATATTVAANAHVSACFTAIAAALIGARNPSNSRFIEGCLDHLQRAGRAINLDARYSF